MAKLLLTPLAPALMTDWRSKSRKSKSKKSRRSKKCK